MKRWTALILVMVMVASLTLCSANAESSVGDLIRFVPTKLTVEYNKVKVDGYFVNLNSECSVSDFREFDMSVYMEGRLLVDGDFGTINSFEVKAMGIYPQSFTFNGSHSLNYGTYTCDDRVYCTFSARFTAHWK